MEWFLISVQNQICAILFEVGFGVDPRSGWINYFVSTRPLDTPAQAFISGEAVSVIGFQLCSQPHYAIAQAIK
jgi:hypothetical protein